MTEEDGGLRSKAAKELPAILARIASTDNEIVVVALADLALRAGFIDARSVSRFVAYLISIATDDSRPPSHRSLAIMNLEKHARDQIKVKSVIISALKDSSRDVRRQSLQSLGTWSDLTEAELDAIRDLENDKDFAVRNWVQIVLRNAQARNTKQLTNNPMHPSGGSFGS